MNSEMSPSDNSPTAIQNEKIQETLDQWATAIKDSDSKAIGNLVTDDAIFWTHGAPELQGREALISSFEPVFNQYSMDQQFQISELIIAGDYAFIRGMETNRLTSLQDGSETVVQQRAFSILKKDSEGTWRFHRGMTNLSPQD